MKSDTIAAIATSPGNGGIGIIRVSGEDAISIVNRIYYNKKKERTLVNYKSHTIHYGFLIDQNQIVDEVMVSVMKAPNSYTMEDTVEINCHGGMRMLSRILTLVIENGARLAEPGEFTKRAFLNGRIDLTQAEAVMDTIQATNDLALKASVAQLKGSVSNQIKRMRADILHEIAFIESALDDPEHISLDGYSESLVKKTDSLLEECFKLIRSFDSGKIIKEGIYTVIVGKPNAGKSSLLNLLLGQEKAIVTDIAGTTRDTLEESMMIGDIRLNIADTAGIRNTQDVIEKIGVERSRSYARKADLILYVVDASLPLDDNDREIMDLLKDKKVIVLMNKSDLPAVIDEYELKEAIVSHRKNQGDAEQDWSLIEQDPDVAVIRTSTVSSDSETGVDQLEKVIRQMFLNGDIDSNSEMIITNIRHKEALDQARNSLQHVQKSLSQNMPEDFYSIDLMSAYTSLGKIIGEEVEDDLVNEIFSKFCMGK